MKYLVTAVFVLIAGISLTACSREDKHPELATGSVPFMQPDHICPRCEVLNHPELCGC